MAAMLEKLTPAQEAQIPIWVAKFIALGLKTLPKGTTDQVLAFNSAKDALIAAEKTTLKKFEHIIFDPADPFNEAWEAKNGVKKDIFYIFTGPWEDLKAMQRKFLGKDDIKFAEEPCQHAVDSSAFYTFWRDVCNIKVGNSAELTEILLQFTKNCGIMGRYQNAAFVGDHPIEHKRLEDGKLQVIWQ